MVWELLPTIPDGKEKDVAAAYAKNIIARQGKRALRETIRVLESKAVSENIRQLVTIETPVPLSHDALAVIQERYRGAYFRERVLSHLIGGVRITVDGIRLDASADGLFSSLKRSMNE